MFIINDFFIIKKLRERERDWLNKLIEEIFLQNATKHFFFFWEIKNCCHFIQITSRSADTIKIESGETNSIETCKGKETFTIWAKTCVIALWNFCLLVWNFYTKLVPSLIKDVDTLPYRPVRSEFFVPVNELVQKHLQNVLLKISAYIGQYRPYRSILDVSAEKEKFGRYKN